MVGINCLLKSNNNQWSPKRPSQQWWQALTSTTTLSTSGPRPKRKSSINKELVLAVYQMILPQTLPLFRYAWRILSEMLSTTILRRDTSWSGKNLSLLLRLLRRKGSSKLSYHTDWRGIWLQITLIHPLLLWKPKASSLRIQGNKHPRITLLPCPYPLPMRLRLLQVRKVLKAAKASNQRWPAIKIQSICTSLTKSKKKPMPQPSTEATVFLQAPQIQALTWSWSHHQALLRTIQDSKKQGIDILFTTLELSGKPLSPRQDPLTLISALASNSAMM